jgi:tRNA (Thr-GGU) A37 N-methylase
MIQHNPIGLASLQIHPMRDGHAPLAGIFATRSPQRPDAIGFCASELIGDGDRLLHVCQLDALDETPVLGIKPYVPGRHALENTRMGAYSLDSRMPKPNA